jgi:hypothetical protein
MIGAGPGKKPQTLVGGGPARYCLDGGVVRRRRLVGRCGGIPARTGAPRPGPEPFRREDLREWTRSLDPTE